MTSRRIEWLVPASLVALSLVPAIAGTVRAVEVVGGAAATPANARFLAAPIPILLHVAAVIPYSVLGAFQFARGFRRRHRALHRALGRVLVPCALVVATSGLWMTQFYPWPAGDGVAVYLERLVVGIAMLAALAQAVVAIRRRDFATHGEWMIRAYALGLGAGTQVLTHLPWLLVADGRPGETARGVMMGAGWAINVVVAEWIIRRGRTRPTAALAPAA